MKKIRSLPYGYLIRNGKRVIDEKEASVVRRIFREYQEGASMSEIAVSLTRAQIPYSENRTEWNKNHIARIIANPRYAGADNFEPIIDPDVFKNANLIKNSRSNGRTFQNDSTIGIIRAKILCGRCGSRMVRMYDQRNRVPASWLCDCPDCHTRVTLADEALESKIVTRMNDLINSPCQLMDESVYRNDDEESKRRSKLTSELGWMCDSGHYSDEQLISIILENAQKRYSQCSEDPSKTTSAISLAYTEATPTEKLNSELFLKTVSNIVLSPDGSIALRLISGKEI